MSTIIMAAVWPLPMPPAQKAVLVSLADQANDQGGCWPAISTLAERTCLSGRTVQRALRWLEEHGAVMVDRRNKGDGSLSSNLYTVQPSKYVPDAESGAETFIERGGDTVSPPVMVTPPPCHGVTTPPDTMSPPPCHGVTLTVNEPSVRTNTPPTPLTGADSAFAETGEGKVAAKRRGSELMTLAQMLEACKAVGQQAIPADDPIWAYAETVGLSAELVALQWWAFKARRSTAGKRQRGIDGWRQTFRSSVRDNWYRFWFIRPGEGAQLTTVGIQADMERRAQLAQAANDSTAQGEDRGARHG